MEDKAALLEIRMNAETKRTTNASMEKEKAKDKEENCKIKEK
mgnify:CR=1 FL=1